VREYAQFQTMSCNPRAPGRTPRTSNGFIVPTRPFAAAPKCRSLSMTLLFPHTVGTMKQFTRPSSRRWSAMALNPEREMVANHGEAAFSAYPASSTRRAGPRVKGRCPILRRHAAELHGVLARPDLSGGPIARPSNAPKCPTAGVVLAVSRPRYSPQERGAQGSPTGAASVPACDPGPLSSKSHCACAARVQPRVSIKLYILREDLHHIQRFW